MVAGVVGTFSIDNHPLRQPQPFLFEINKSQPLGMTKGRVRLSGNVATAELGAVGPMDESL
jgi:hypothetical protein